MLIILFCIAVQLLIYYKRVVEHKSKVFKDSFTLRYNIEKLVYFEAFSIAGDAFTREKQIKAGSRKRKVELIEKMNPGWRDLFDRLKGYQGEELIRMKRILS